MGMDRRSRRGRCSVFCLIAAAAAAADGKEMPPRTVPQVPPTGGSGVGGGRRGATGAGVDAFAACPRQR